jgi:hypothetical protein
LLVQEGIPELQAFQDRANFRSQEFAAHLVFWDPRGVPKTDGGTALHGGEGRGGAG